MRKELTLFTLKELFNKIMSIKGDLGMEYTKILVRVNHENYQIYEDQCLFQSRPKSVNNAFLAPEIEQNIIIDMDSCNFLTDFLNEDNYIDKNNNTIEKSSLGDMTLLSKEDNYLINDKVKVKSDLIYDKLEEKLETPISFNNLTVDQKERIYLELCDYLDADGISVSIIKTDKGVELKIDQS